MNFRTLSSILKYYVIDYGTSNKISFIDINLSNMFYKEKIYLGIYRDLKRYYYTIKILKIKKSMYYRKYTIS